MAAVNAVCVLDYSISEAAELLMQCPNWVSHWVRRFEEGGIDALLVLLTHLKTRPVHCSSVEAISASVLPRVHRAADEKVRSSSVEAISASVLPCTRLMCTASILTRILPSLSFLHA